jgi:hypothetical protein
MVSSRSREGFRRPSDREDILYRDRGQLGLFITTFFANFGELRKDEVRRILIPRTTVNKGRKKRERAEALAASTLSAVAATL